jgi:hypothetical protein
MQSCEYKEAGFPPDIFKKQQIPHEIKEKALFVSLRVLIPSPSTLWQKP